MTVQTTWRAVARHLATACVLSTALTAPHLAAAQQMAAAQPASTVAPAAGVAAASETALAGDQSRTRFIIGLERQAEFHVSSLPNPNRVIVELPEMKLDLPKFAGTHAVGLVQSFRSGLSAPGKAKIVIDVTAAVVVEKATIDKGRDGKSPRLVLEIVPVDANPKAAQAKKALGSATVASLGGIGLQPPLPKPATNHCE